MKIQLLLLILLVAGQVSCYPPTAQYDLRDNLNDQINAANQLIFHSPQATPSNTIGRNGLPAFYLQDDEYFRLPSSNIADISSDEQFSISLWAKLDPNTQRASSDVITVQVSQTGGSVLSEIRVAHNQVQFGPYLYDYPLDIVSENKFQQIYIVVENDGTGKYAEIYLQGHQVLRKPIPYDYVIQSVLFGQYFYGIISDIKVYNIALTEMQIKELDDHSYTGDYSQVKSELLSYYPFHNGQSNDAKQRFSNVLVPTTAQLHQDKFNIPDRAIKLINQEIVFQDNFKIYDPSQSQISSFSITAQVKKSAAFQPGEQLLQVKTLLDSSQPQQGDTTPGQGTGGTTNPNEYWYNLSWQASEYIILDQWQTYSITFEVMGAELVSKYYVDHYLVYESKRNLPTTAISITEIRIGYVPSTQQTFPSEVIVNDLIIHKKALSKWEVSYITDLPEELAQSTTTPTPNCIDLLKDLESNLVSLNLNIVYEASLFKQIYIVSFGQFSNLESCFENEVTFTHSTHGKQQIPITRVAGSSDLEFSFAHNDASSYGCVKSITNTREMSCNFQLQVAHQGTVQMTKQFTSIIRTPDLNDIQNGLQLQIIGDNSQIFTNFDQAIQTEIIFCSDATCATPKNDLVLVRNEVSYIQLRILSEGFNNYYPAHKSLKLGTAELVPENLSEIQNWSQQGYIIYAVKPHFSSNTMMLSIQIALSEHAPTTPPPSPPGNPGSGSGRRLQQVDSELSLGKQVYVQVLENKEQLQNNQKLDYILKLSFGVMAFISVMTITAVVGFIKYKNIQKSQYRPTQQVDSIALEKL